MNWPGLITIIFLPFAFLFASWRSDRADDVRTLRQEKHENVTKVTIANKER